MLNKSAWRNKHLPGSRIYVRDAEIYAGGERIAPFSVRITSEDHLRRQHRMAVLFPDGSERTLEASFSSFKNGSWLTQLGSPGLLARADTAQERRTLRSAILELSQPIDNHTGPLRLGWTCSEGAWSYTGSGAEVDPGLVDYHLPPPVAGPDLERAIRASLGLLDVAPDPVTIPILAGVYLAPLAPWVPVTFTLFICGPTGSKKSGLAGEAMAHYGQNFSYNRLPGTFESTNAALLQSLDRAQDVLFVLDDLDPGGGAGEVRRKHQTASRLIRIAGNGAQRARIAPGGGSASLAPRGMLAVTAEDIPAGESIRARLALVQVQPGDVDLAMLKGLHGVRGDFSRAMASYVFWLERRNGVPRDDLQKRVRAYEAVLGRNFTGHDRLLTNYATLLLGIDYLAFFATENGVLPQQEAVDLQNRAIAAIAECLRTHGELMDSEALKKRTFRLLRTALQQGRAHIAQTDGLAPDGAQTWGWTWTSRGFRKQGRLVGWLDHHGACNVLLDGTAMMTAVRSMASQEGEPLGLSNRAVLEQLKAEGLATPARAKIAGQHRDVLQVDLAALTGGPVDQ